VKSSLNVGGMAGIVFAVFLVLKLTHTIAWSWWWVTAPLWGGAALAIVWLVITFAVAYWASDGFRFL